MDVGAPRSAPTRAPTVVPARAPIAAPITAPTPVVAEASRPTIPRGFLSTGNADRYLLEADALRRRQLCSALLHGTTRSWRYRRRLWLAALAGAVVLVVIVSVIAVANAFARQTRLNQEQAHSTGQG